MFVRGLLVVGTFIRMHPGPFAIAVAGAAIYSVATVATAYVFGRVADDVILPAFSSEGVDRGRVWAAAAAIVGVAVVRSIGVVFRRFFAGMHGARVQATLRERIVDRYRALPLAYHRAQPTGELLAHAEADVMAATEALHPLPFSTAAVMLTTIALISLLLTDPFLAMIGFLMLPVLAFLNRLFGHVMEPPATRAQDRVGEVSALAHESFDGALMVKTLGREAAEVQRMRSKVDELLRERLHMGRINSTFTPAFSAIPVLGSVVLIGVGAWRVSNGDISIGTLVQFVSLFQLLAFPMGVIGYFLWGLPRSVVGDARIRMVLNTRDDIPATTESLDVPDGPLSISARDVSFWFGDNRVLDRVSFEVEPNEAVAIVGPTGAGKSTLAELLVRLADPTYGSIRVGGVDLRHMTTTGLQEIATIVFQESFLFATTVRDNIALDGGGSDDEVEWAARLAQAHDFIKHLPAGYDTVVGERGVTLSGGQRQRVALARALVRRPRAIVLDDATSAVDPTIEAAILNGLRSELDATLIVIAYRASTVAMADRVLFLEHGRIGASGTHAELLRYAPYEAMLRAYERGAA